MFCAHFSSLKCHHICHVCRSESKFGFITQPRHSHSLPIEKFQILWTVLLSASLKPREQQPASQEWLTVASCNRTAHECHHSWRAHIWDLELGNTGWHEKWTKSFTKHISVHTFHIFYNFKGCKHDYCLMFIQDFKVLSSFTPLVLSSFWKIKMNWVWL